MGRRQDAQAILGRLTQPSTSPGNYADDQDAAYVRLALGLRDEALDGLERAVDRRSDRILWLRVDPRVDALRAEPRFQQLVTRIGNLP
jgi:hypothetical protein